VDGNPKPEVAWFKNKQIIKKSKVILKKFFLNKKIRKKDSIIQIYFCLIVMIRIKLSKEQNEPKCFEFPSVPFLVYFSFCSFFG
jgi:hypothetical protein